MGFITLSLVIIVITSLISIQAFNKREIMYKLEYSPYLVSNKRQFYRMGSVVLVHSDGTHLFVNMLVLFMFGRSVEGVFSTEFGFFGPLLFLLLYIGGALFASLPAMGKHRNNPNYRAVGASGAVSSIVFCFILIFPTENINLLILPFLDIPAWIFGGMYLALEYYLDKRSMDNVAHDAHFWGALFGIIFPLLLRPELGPRFLALIGVF